MSDEKEPFIARWSRLRTEARKAPAEPSPAAGAAPAATDTGTAKSADAANGPQALPPLDELSSDSDFKPFMHPQVDEGTRRAALKKLFADSRFNVPDPFEAYSEDYTGGEPIPPEVLKTLKQAKKLLFDDAEKTAQAGTEKTQEPRERPEETQGPQETQETQGPRDGAAGQDA